MIEGNKIITEFSANPEFLTALQEALAELAAEQERLGPEFERVLFEDLWEMYER